jgi:hypothetical protein
MKQEAREIGRSGRDTFEESKAGAFLHQICGKGAERDKRTGQRALEGPGFALQRFLNGRRSLARILNLQAGRHAPL